MHWPVALHAWPLAQPLQVAPPVPQDVVDCAAYASHVPVAVQQPAGHDAASQTHWPAALQALPLAHAPQATPPVPHDAFDCPAYASHVPLAVQHPIGHDAASQTH